MTLSIFVVAIMTLVLLLIAEKRHSLPGKLIFKPLLSFLFIWTAVQQTHADGMFAAWVLAGLSLSWIGDVLLIFKARTLFMGGLLAFLLGHVCYALAFYGLGAFRISVASGLLVLSAAGALVFKWLWPYLGALRIPVAAYIVVISAMVGGALAVWAADSAAAAGRWSVLTGAIAFYLSDICVARDQFVADAYVNRLIGLPLYYLAQFLLAVSIGWVGV